uniref:Uncharacterized protein n=1 Tax=Nymphaea colorata TaxID=210225 RepID=A0A5K1B8Q7_9MAGN
MVYGRGGGVEGEEHVVGAPFDELSDVIILSHGFVLLRVLHGAPGEHRHGEGHRKTELYVVSGVIVPSHQPSLHVRQPRPVL